MCYKTTGKKTEQSKTFNLRFTWTGDDGETISRRYYTKKHAARELGISYTSITRKLKGMNVPKYKKYSIEPIREPARVKPEQLTY
jgi:hypothetical protein